MGFKEIPVDIRVFYSICSGEWNTKNYGIFKKHDIIETCSLQEFPPGD